MGALAQLGAFLTLKSPKAIRKMFRASLIALLLVPAVTAQTTCTSDADCSGTVPTCVEESEYYSACTDCGANAFAQQCVYYSSQFLEAAEAACNLLCPGRCPGGTNAECAATNNATECVKNSDGDLCIDCSSQDAFNDQCFYLSDSLVLQAESVCGLTCQGRCPNHVNSDCTTSGDVCVVQADGYFDECISCAPSDFQSECVYMSDAMRAAAEDTCGLNCNMTAMTRNIHQGRAPKRVA